jgi:hypothetical protein
MKIDGAACFVPPSRGKVAEGRMGGLAGLSVRQPRLDGSARPPFLTLPRKGGGKGSDGEANG